jgi:hypothetical protein
VEAAEVRLRAERRLGELLKGMPKAKGAARPGVGRRGECADVEAEHSDAAKLGEIGITHKQSSVWQRIAALAALASPLDTRAPAVEALMGDRLDFRGASRPRAR